MTVVRRTPYRNTVQNSQLRRKVTTLVSMHVCVRVHVRPCIYLYMYVVLVLVLVLV